MSKTAHSQTSLTTVRSVHEYGGSSAIMQIFKHFQNLKLF